MVAFYRNITDRKNAEEALRHSERHAVEAAYRAEEERRRLDALLEAAPVGIAVSNASGKLVHVNAENRHLWGNHPMSASVDDYEDWKGWWADGSKRQGQPLQPHEWSLARALHGEEASRQVIEIESFDFPYPRRIILNSGASIRDGKGQIIGAVVAQMDITDRVKAEKAMREADRNKNDFIAILAHELRNPLAPIRNGLEVMRLVSSNPAAVVKVQEMMSRQVDHMVHLIDDLLDMARIDSGKIELKKARVDLKTIAVSAVEASLPMIDAAQHRLEMHIPDEPLPLNADATRLAQVLTNLLANSAKYTPKGGHIELAARRDGQDVVISVSDSGIGIPEVALGTIFDMFSQVERSLGRSQGGLGIGLFLVNRLVQMHGGSVVARSPGEGRGSTFIMRLPLAEESHTDETPSYNRDAAFGEASTSPLRIVVADDNADAADSMASLLRLSGHTVAVANDGYEALKLIRDQHPEVMFLDIGMPGLDGYEVARLVRKSSSMEGAMLVALTGWGAEHDRAKAREVGFDHHLTKPADIQAIEKVLRSYQSTAAG
jgi:signal transduction histidine kinase/ActR/RegA family two-component response regulator